MQEKTVEQRLRNEVKKIGGKAFKLVGQFDNGTPDRLVCLPGGRVVFVELKRPKGGRLSEMQKYRHAELRQMGFDVRVINTTEAVMQFTNEMKEVIQDEIHTARLPELHN